MTPKPINVEVVRAKLDAIDRACETLESIGAVDRARLEQDPVVCAAVERLLGRVVDLAVDINSHIVSVRTGRGPAEYRETFDLIARIGALDPERTEPLKRTVGIRNAIVHEYVKLDYGQVAAAIPLAVETYRTYVTSLAKWVISVT